MVRQEFRPFRMPPRVIDGEHDSRFGILRFLAGARAIGHSGIP
jgi:hypothetical protein